MTLRVTIPSSPTMNTSRQPSRWLARLRSTFAGPTAGAVASPNPWSLAVNDLMSALDKTLLAWAQSVELRKGGASEHIQRVTKLTLAMTRVVGMADSELVSIRRGAILHDIGEMRLPDSVLLKPGRLLPDERALLHQHPQYAYEMLSPIEYLCSTVDIPYCHHERWDGAGYPRGLKGERIPLAARLFAVADTWDSLHTDRLYRKAWPDDDVWRFLDEQAGAEYDPDAVKALRQVLTPQQ